jgi:hypothetical protein
MMDVGAGGVRGAGGGYAQPGSGAALFSLYHFIQGHHSKEYSELIERKANIAF